MDVYTLDFETYYDQDYSLSKMTTEDYVRDPRFEVIGLAIKKNDKSTKYLNDPDMIQRLLSHIDFSNAAILAQNTMFDGAILSWRYGVKPKVWFDTMCMGRALHGVETSASLRALAERYGIGEKGFEVHNAKGKRRADFTAEEAKKYGEYCIQDVELTYKLFKIMGAKFPRKELKLIDTTLRMFIDPVLDLDIGLLEQHLEDTRARKDKLLVDAGVQDKKDLMSNPKFADMLRDLGVEPPMKTSPTTGKETYAFAKSDEEFKALQEHEDDRVQTLVAARLGNKSTLEETRTERFIGISKRGLLPVPIRYYAAHTGRWGGADKINLQNLPSRGPNGKKLKKAIIAPEGHTVVEADSSQIEARVLAWFAGQDDLTAAFARGEDVYVKMAARIYRCEEADVTKDQRFVGKTTILGCIAEGTPVLSDSGWKPIEQITHSDRVWDGEEFVCHQGLVPKGTKETLSLCGSWLTPDHKILCGNEWRETGSAVQDAHTLSQVLATGRANLPSQATYAAHGVALKPSLSGAIVEATSTLSTATTSNRLSLHAAPCAHVRQGDKSVIGNIHRLWPTMGTARDFLTAYLQQLVGAITRRTVLMNTTGHGVFTSTPNGVQIEPRSYSLCRPSTVGMYQRLKWIVSTWTEGILQTTSGLSPVAKTSKTNVVSPNEKRRLQTYDLAYAGPRNRFTILTESGPVIAHNCGYGMGAEKFGMQLKTFGYEVPPHEVRRIIQIYRDANYKISKVWRDANFMVQQLANHRAVQFGRKGIIEVDAANQALIVPSGLKIFYPELHAEQGEKGVEYTYKVRRGRTRIYGGKVIENVCQAIARCIIGEQMLQINKKYKVVLTVHDSIACCVPDAEVEEAQAYVEKCMRWIPGWASGLPVDCESGTGKSYGDCE